MYKRFLGDIFLERIKRRGNSSREGKPLSYNVSSGTMKKDKAGGVSSECLGWTDGCHWSKDFLLEGVRLRAGLT